MNRNGRRRTGRPKGLPKTGGRKAGTRNKVTVEARAAATEIVDSRAYRRKLATRALNGTLAPAMETLLWHYAKGRPMDDALPLPQVLGLLRAVAALFLEVVEDSELRRAFAAGLRRKLPLGADLGVAFDAPVPRALPAVEDELVL
jgi:hypothetical protein